LANSTGPVRVRFAPSPTGYPHLGNIRTALFNWLFARHNNGTFVLRIEDTDAARKVEGAVEIIMDSLQWLGLDWDEGPFFQSQRLQNYKDIADRLVAEDKAYLCYCSPERLDEVRREQMKRKQPPGYDRHCRSLTKEQKVEIRASGITPVVRFKSPLEGQTTFKDLIKGEVTFENKVLDDFVLLKSDGYPTYHLANIIDDHIMNISHVLRADEWLSSTPRHMLLYQAVGWQPPEFAHLPMILGPDRAKLSKRHGATAINEYRDKGYLPEAMINFLSLLGWSLDDKTELLSCDEIIAHFSLERVSKTAAVFNNEKLDWMNGIYIRNLDIDQFAERAVPFMERELPDTVKRPLDTGYIRQIMPLIQERAKTLDEIPALTDFFFVDDIDYEPSALLGKLDPEQASHILSITIEKLDLLKDWTTDALETMLRPLAAELEVKTGLLFGLLRTATTGKTAAPPLFQTMEVLGRETSMERIRKALDKIS
jgi:glutamyl-tRNA synthetase